MRLGIKIGEVKKIMSTPHTPVECAKCEAKSKSFMCSTSDGISNAISGFKADCMYRPGDVIFRAGDLPAGLFSIRSGVVKLESLSEDGDAHTLKLVGPGGVLPDFF